MACPYLNYQWVTSAEIARCRIVHCFSAFPHSRRQSRFGTLPFGDFDATLK
jgi:hypothetical protein